MTNRGPTSTISPPAEIQMVDEILAAQASYPSQTERRRR